MMKNIKNEILEYIKNHYSKMHQEKVKVLKIEDIIEKFNDPNDCLRVIKIRQSLKDLHDKKEIKLNSWQEIFLPINELFIPQNKEQEKAIKYDQDKNRLELLPWHAILEVGKIVTFGGKKYGDYNWLKGMKWSRLYGAALRHLTSWINKEDKDPETNLSHLAHAACCILFLLSYELLNIGEDDRWKKEIKENNKLEKKDKFKSLKELSDENRKEVYDFAMKRSDNILKGK